MSVGFIFGHESCVLSEDFPTPTEMPGDTSEAEFEAETCGPGLGNDWVRSG
jgi:hypothetical protein